MNAIRHERSGHTGRFVWLCAGERFAEMSYTVAGTRVIVDHIDVHDRLRGTGTAGRLVAAAVEWVRWENARISRA